MPSEPARLRGSIPVGVACALLAVCAAGCEPREGVLHPVFADSSQLIGSTPLKPDALIQLEGMFSVKRGAGRFGGTVATHATKETLSFFTNAHHNYAILRAGCLGGTKLVLEGHWRYASSSDTGLLRVAVGPPALAAALCNWSGPPATPLPAAQFDGSLGVGDSRTLPEVLSLSFVAPLKPRATMLTRFWVAAHHGACPTVDDCGASENSIPSLRMVESFGASDVEVDVRLTADGVPILFHDDNFGPRLASGTFCHGPVERFTLADVRSLCKLNFGEEVPTLEEALAAVVDQTDLAAIWLDLKVPEAVGPTVAVVTRYRAVAKQKNRKLDIIFGLGESEVLAAYRALKVPPGALCLVELLPDDVRSAGCQFWGPRWTRGPMVSDVQALQGENRFVMYWTIDDPVFIDLYLRQAKPNGILTDRPGLVFHRFETLGVMPKERLP